MTFQFKIQLKDISSPPVWRKIQVPAQFTFYRFHNVIQVAFGWKNYHLFQFSSNGWRSKEFIGVPDGSYDNNMVDSKKIKLNQVFDTPGQKFTYLYDFGDNWLHQITLENITGEQLKKAKCIQSKGTCPPEDCGGAGGYLDLKDILANPHHAHHKEMREWLNLKPNENWQPDQFEIEKINTLIAAV